MWQLKAFLDYLLTKKSPDFEYMEDTLSKDVWIRNASNGFAMRKTSHTTSPSGPGVATSWASTSEPEAPELFKFGHSW